MKLIFNKNGFLSIVFLSILLTSIWGCYTSFQHPNIDNPKWGRIQISDDCSECHAQNRYEAPVLPNAAAQDFNWQFYAASPWWQDEMSLDGASVSGGPESTGPRSVIDGDRSYNPPLSASPAAPVQSLGKSGSQESSGDSSSKDDRRSVGRRTHTTSDSQTETEKNRSTRSRRSED